MVYAARVQPVKSGRQRVDLEMAGCSIKMSVDRQRIPSRIQQFQGNTLPACISRYSAGQRVGLLGAQSQIRLDQLSPYYLDRARRTQLGGVGIKRCGIALQCL